MQEGLVLVISIALWTKSACAVQGNENRFHFLAQCSALRTVLSRQELALYHLMK